MKSRTSGDRFITTSGDNIPIGVLPNGESPMCDFYEARFMDLLALAPDEWQRIGN
jgi:hypothetical protein